MLAGVVFCCAAIAQNTPQFEVASIRPSPDVVDNWQNIGVHVDGAMVRCATLSLKDYISIAYRVKLPQISGPDWIASVKFDIQAKLPDGARRAEVPEMMQALLAERFKLQLHRESKELPVYALVPGKGPVKLKKSAPDPSIPAPENVNVTVSGINQGALINLGPGSSISTAGGKIVGTRVTLPQLLNSLERFLDRPVVDMTGLNGVYDVTLEYSLEEVRNVLRVTGSSVTIPDSAAAAFPGSIRDSFAALGLRLEARKAPMDVLVIDHMERTPLAN